MEGSFPQTKWICDRRATDQIANCLKQALSSAAVTLKVWSVVYRILPVSSLFSSSFNCKANYSFHFVVCY